jgi:hypothetical protein
MSRKKKQFCVNGHEIAVVGRDSTGHCNECVKEHRPKRAEYNKEYYARTQNIQIARSRKYRAENPEKIKEYNEQYTEDHKDELLVKWKAQYDPQKAHGRYEAQKDKLDAQNKAWSKTLEGRYSRLKTKAKNRKIFFDLTFEQYVQIIQNACYYCGLNLLLSTGGCIDRIDNDKNVGYILTNVLPCCVSCNVIRNRLHTIEETLVMVRTLKAIQKFPILIDVLKNKDLGFVKSPFIDEKSWYPRRGKLRHSDLKPIARYKVLVGRQKIENIFVTLSFAEYEKVISNPCFYCGADLAYSKGRGLDRTNPFGIYEINNVLPCCFVCNTIKNNRFTVDETKVMVIVRNLFRKKFLQEK